MKKGDNMQDNLKDRISKSRDDFEVYSFEGDWENIANKVPKKKNEKNFRWLYVAASLSMIIASLFVIVKFSGNSQIPNELAEIEYYYSSEINQKISLIKNKPNGKDVLADFETMDRAFEELKLDLKDNVDNEEVLMAMMENYRLKLEILERIIKKLEKDENEKSL